MLAIVPRLSGSISAVENIIHSPAVVWACISLTTRYFILRPHHFPSINIHHATSPQPCPPKTPVAAPPRPPPH
jgi:hypothetical protein